MSTGRHTTDGANAGLGELFTFDDEPAVQRAPVDRGGSLMVSIVLTLSLSAVVLLFFRIANLAPSFLLVLAVCAGLVFVRREARLLREPTPHHTRDIVRAPQPSWSDGIEDQDGMLAAVRRWDRRLSWSTAGADRFATTVAPRLGELADERLRQRHGITRASDPAAAHRLLGDDLWRVIHGPLARVPSPQQIGAVLTNLENV